MLEEAQSRKFYWLAVACFAITAISVLVYSFTKIPYIQIISILGVVGYVAFALLSKPKYKRTAEKSSGLSYMLSRLIIFVIIIMVIIYAFIGG